MKTNTRSMVVGVAGPIGSGKTTLAIGLAKALECPIASFGTYVRDVAARTGRPGSREVLQEISEQLILSLGPRDLTRNVINEAGWDRRQSIVVDGIRHPQVVVALRQEVEPLPVILVYLDVTPEVRRERLVTRDNLSDSEVRLIDSHSTERHVGTKVRALADVIVTAGYEPQDTIGAVIKTIDDYNHVS